MKRAAAVIGIVVVVMTVIVVVEVQRDEDPESVLMGSTSCVRDPRDILTAQSVPDARLVPCLTDAVASWMFTSESYSSDGTKIVLQNQTVPEATWQMAFAPTCQPDAGATTHDSQVDGLPATASVVSRSLSDSSDKSGVAQVTWTRFAGGCVTATVSAPGSLDRQLILDETERLLVLVPRSVLSDDVLRAHDGRLPLQ